jgi:hypothetical protein
MTFAKDEFGFIAGSQKSKAAGMYLKGATRKEVETALGNPYLNVLTEIEKLGFKIIRNKVRIGKNRPHYRYTIIK